MGKKTIEQYDPSNYACYAVTGVKEDFTLNTVLPTGLQEYTNYDTYDLGNKTLIAFTKANFKLTDFVYRLVSQNYTEDILYENYEFLVDVLEDNYDKSKSVFHIMNSAADYHDILGNRPAYTEDSRRCDLDGYAAVAFYESDKEDAGDVVDKSYYNDENIEGWTVYLSSMSNIYIVKIDFIELNDSLYKQWPCRVNMAQTFPHAMKLAYEWNLLAQDPWSSNEQIAEKCKNAFDEWAIPADAIEEINNGQPDTSLALFFSANGDPRESIEENSQVGSKFKNWFISKLRYRTLGSLNVNYPDQLQIPESMIQKEMSFFETVIYTFCIENKLDLDNVTAIEMLDIAYYSGPGYKERNNTIVDVIKKSVYLENQTLIKEYVKNKQKRVNVAEYTKLEQEFTETSKDLN
jgi:hypothetical protein